MPELDSDDSVKDRHPPNAADGRPETQGATTITLPPEVLLWLRRIAIVICLAAAATLVVLLILGIEARVWRLITLLSVCILIAIIAVLLPRPWRTRLSVLVGAFVAAAGVIPLVVNEQEAPAPAPTPTPTPVESANPQYLADLVRKGPFTESLPRPFKAGALQDVQIGDPSSIRKLDAVRLRISVDPREKGVGGEGYMETYRTPAEARVRAQASMDTLVKQYSFIDDPGTTESFCINTDMAWICGGFKGYVYAEASVHPGANAYLPLATGTVSAMLRYSDRMRVLASK